RTRRPGPVAAVPDRAAAPLRRRAGPARPGLDQPDVGAAEVRGTAPAHPARGSRRPGPGGGEGRRDLRPGAVLAGVLRRCAVAPAVVGLARSPRRPDRAGV